MKGEGKEIGKLHFQHAILQVVFLAENETAVVLRI